MTIAISARIVVTGLCCVLVLASWAEGAWVLWARTCNVKSQVCGEWQRRETYEAERWCRAARTRAINQALTPAARQAAKGTVVEYECVPDNADPGSKGK